MVSLSDSIGVEHWHNVKDVLLPQLPRFYTVRQQKIDDPFQRERTLSLSWMDPAGDYHSFFRVV